MLKIFNIFSFEWLFFQKHSLCIFSFPDNIRQSSGLSCQFVTFSDYEKLEMALLSGLPNEVDFVVNVCTLLSNDGKRSLRLDKSKHLLDLLLAHIGIFNNGKHSF